MGIIEAVVLGVVEGVTEFLPVSSTAHLTITEKLFGFATNNSGIVAFTAIIQLGATLATLLYFREDIRRIAIGWLVGIVRAEKRHSPEYKFGWAVILGSIPIAVVGLLFKDQVEHNLRSLWLVAFALIAWSGVMWLADQAARQNRHEKDTTWRDTLIIGLAQCLALVPGVSRSGATMSAGLFRGFDRIAVTRLSFFLGIPALLAAGLLEAVTKASDISGGVGWTPTLIATATTFIVAYASIAWLLKYISRHSFTIFVVYRVGLGVILIVLLASGLLSAT